MVIYVCLKIQIDSGILDVLFTKMKKKIDLIMFINVQN